ncbi:hypothetical protein K470DRAFT_268702 [Piedraia hortae CBS 480.64]|uniref:Uncharacterized protein n=1 Tax=Piedraia hortae CBS 480.64 TaxID=1314780 RepID=A0A6A7C579_9PEZI|nr:hypothetical protein K470DRAFT_268702 [Piedraia hortae CBS 480.64]
MALHRGLQSAIFYYLSCAPCAEARYRRKRKEEAKIDRANRERLEAEYPDCYRHPSPSSTNPHWASEIAAGPTGVTRGKRKPPGSNRREASSNENRAWPGNGAAEIIMPERVRTRDSYRHPPINDWHPATVTKVHSREDVAWLTEPMPTADVMSGKTPPSTRAPTSASNRSKMSTVPTLSLTLPTISLSPSPDLSTDAGLQAPRRSFGEAMQERKTRRQAPDPVKPVQDPYTKTYVATKSPTLYEDSVTGISASSSTNNSLKEVRQIARKSTGNLKDDLDHHPGVAIVTSLVSCRRALMTPRTPKRPSPSPLPRDSDDDTDFLSLVDSWYTPDIDLDEWVHEFTKRDGISHRWSMDI